MAEILLIQGRKPTALIRRVTRKAVALARQPRIRFATLGRPGLQFSIKTAADAGPKGDVWGDVFFANDLAESLRRLGHTVFVDRLGEAVRPSGSRGDDVVIHLRGLHRTYAVEGAVNILWVISHPDLVDDDELRSGFDIAFAAGAQWAREKTAHSGVNVRPLLQATNPRRFHPGAPTESLKTDVLFLGKSRNVFRPVVRDAIHSGADVSIYGDGWAQFIDPRYIRAEFLENDRVPDAYRSARVVLNDHWDDMKQHGFLSNRLFDAVACGAVVITDDIVGAESIFGTSVARYKAVEDLKNLMAADFDWPSESQRLRTFRSLRANHSFDSRARTILASIRVRLIRRLVGSLLRSFRRALARNS